MHNINYFIAHTVFRKIGDEHYILKFQKEVDINDIVDDMPLFCTKDSMRGNDQEVQKIKPRKTRIYFMIFIYQRNLLDSKMKKL